MTFDISRTAQYIADHDLTVCPAESCTAGLIVSLLAEVEGCGSWLEGGFVAYSPEAKGQILGVSEATIDLYGLTSEPVAREMAIGALEHGTAGVALANTGLAGPPPTAEALLPGTQCFAWAFSGSEGYQVYSETKVFSGDRNQVREVAAVYAIDQLPVYHRRFFTSNRNCGNSST